jgi:cobalt-zinc-cadmium efflux system protein
VPAASAQVRDRLASGMRHVDGLPVLIVSGVAALVMTGGELVLRRHHEDETDEHDQSVTAVLLDTIADAAAAGVAAKGAIILATDGWYWLDPAVVLTIPGPSDFSRAK